MVTKHVFFAKSFPAFEKWTFIFVHFLFFKKTFVDFITLFNIINWIFNLKKKKNNLRLERFIVAKVLNSLFCRV
jgi:hypothetical protein